jgi:hypothetical protein
MLKTNLLIVGKVGETKKRKKGTVKSSDHGQNLSFTLDELTFLPCNGLKLRALLDEEIKRKVLIFIT